MNGSRELSMSADEFLLQIVGQGVSPRSVDSDDLTGVVRGFRGALASIAKAAGMDEDDIFLGLTGVSGDEVGHETLTLLGSRECLKTARRLVSALNAPSQSALPDRARSHLRSIWKIVFDNGWDACTFAGNGSNIGTASILLEKELFPIPGTHRGTTVLYGECLRAGGEGRRTAQLKLHDGGRVTVRLKTKELAQQLGQRLYQTVGLQGEAIWLTATNKLSEFRADSLTDFTDRDAGASAPRTIAQAFSDLAKAAGNRWDEVDPEEFVKEQRRD